MARRRRKRQPRLTLLQSILILFDPTFRRQYTERQKKRRNGRAPIPQHIRVEVWNRDKGRCRYCKSQIQIEYDHIIPWSRGGADTVRNLQLLCRRCNRRKGAKV